jgi:hypothetical protein
MKSKKTKSKGGLFDSTKSNLSPEDKKVLAYLARRVLGVSAMTKKGKKKDV